MCSVCVAKEVNPVCVCMCTITYSAGSLRYIPLCFSHMRMHNIIILYSVSRHYFSTHLLVVCTYVCQWVSVSLPCAVVGVVIQTS